MAEGGRKRSPFLGFLKRVRAESELSAEDVDRIQHFAVNVRTREEAEITRHPQVMTPRSFMWMCGPVGGPVPKYRNMREGLEATGWAEIPGSIEVGRGAYGHLQLAYKVSESKVPLESRHLCAAKILPLSQHEVGYINNEIKILRGVVHENVVDYFTHYVVENEIEVPHVHILLEYASAGDLMKEMARHPGYHMSEPNARYYTLQIMTGVQYLHSKWIVHNDLHAKNVILKYNPDLSKTCMICDFGASKILTADPDPSEFHVDVNSINTVISLMLGFPVNPLDPISKEAEALMHARKPYLRAGRMMTDEPNTVAEFKAKFSWFRGSVSPSYPKAPTPLLQRKLIQRIGYLPEPVPETTRQWDEPGPSDTTLGPLRLPAHASYRSDSKERSRARSEEEVEAPAAAAAGPVETEERPKKSKSIGGRIRRSISRFGHAVARPFQQLAARRRERNEPEEEEAPQPSRHKSRDK